MAYDDTMVTYSSGDLVALADINKWVGNIDHLHDRKRTIAVSGIGDSAPTAVGDWASRQISNTNAGTQFEYFKTVIPDNFGTLVSIEILLLATTSYTAEYDCNVDYFNPDATENYNQHSGSILNQTVALTADVPKLIDISSTVGSLAAGDFLAVKMSSSTGANGGNWYALQLRIIYTLSDSVA